MLMLMNGYFIWLFGYMHGYLVIVVILVVGYYGYLVIGNLY